MKKTPLLVFHLIFTVILNLQNSAQSDLPEGAIARLGRGVINGITYSPDSTQLVVASSVGIWSYDGTTGTVLPLFRGYAGFALTIAYSPDGDVLASGGEDDTVRLWNANTGEPIAILPGHTDRVASVAYAPNGDLASGSWDNTVHLWSASTNQLKRVLAGHSHWVTSVAYSPDGTQIASGSDDATVRLWEVETGQSTALTMHTGGVTSVAYSPDGSVLVSSAKDNTVRLWDTGTGQPIDTLTEHTDDVTSVMYSPDGSTIVSGSRDGTVCLWDVGTRQLKTKLTGHSRSVVSVAYSPSGALASGSEDGTMLLWDTDAGQPISAIAGHLNRVIAVAYSSSGELASGSEDGAVRLWNPFTGQIQTTFTAHTNRVEALAYSPDGNTLITAGGAGDRSVRLWESATGNSLAIFTGHTSSVHSVAYSPDGSTVASGGGFGDNTVRLWDVATKQLKNTLRGHTRIVNTVAFSRNGDLVSGSRDNTIRLWDTATGQVKATLRGHTDGVYSVMYSPDGNTIASGSRDDTVRLWDVGTEQLKATLIGHTFSVRSVAFSPNGSILASAGEDTTVRLWNAVTGHSITILTGHTHRVRAVAFSPDGSILASGSEDGTVLLWDFTSLHTQEAELQAMVDQLQQQDTRQPKVQLIYFRPRGRASQDITAQVNRVVKDVQRFYARQMKNYGFGIKTFALETDATGKTVMHHVDGRFAEAHYREQPYPKILEEVDAQFDRSNNILLIFIEGGTEILGGNVCGLGGTHQAGGGTAMLPAAGDCFSFRIVAHELGHALGLYHDFRQPNLMSHSSGYLPQLNMCAAEALVVHSAFNATQEDITHTAIQSQPPTVSSAGTIHLRFDVTDMDGLHQIQLIAPGTPEDPIQGIKIFDCIQLSSISETVEFVVPESIFTIGNIIGIRVLDVGGGGTQQWYQDILNTHAHLDVNNDGALNILDLVLVAGKLGQTAPSMRVDVNNDGVVNILDLVTVAAGIVGGTEAAPSMTHHTLDSRPTRTEIHQWLIQAQQLALTDAVSQRGIAVLKQLLAMATPEETALLPNYPNPFNPETWIPYQLAVPAEVTVRIYSATGTEVRTLLLGHQPAGWYQTRGRAAYWDGKNNLGESVANGIYFYTLTATDFTATRKMLILK